MIPEKCSVCGRSNIREVLTCFNTHGRHIIDKNEKFVLHECLDCLTLFPAEKIGTGYYDKYYDSEYYNTKIEDNRILEAIIRWIYGRKEKFILGIARKKDPISILDIGCGTGEFLASLKSAKFDKYGLEINKRGFEECRKKGIAMFGDDIAKTDFGGKKFDVITAWHVLEHLDDPKSLFAGINKIIADDGIVILQTPNPDSLGFHYGKENWFHLDSPRHLHLFQKRGVNFLCKSSGLKITKIRYEWYDYPLDLFWSLRKSRLRFLAYPLYPLVKFFDREHLTYIIKKNGQN